ncbi:MAG: hypothetical protein MUF24_09015 [Chitinophagaceae bacterium]|jgi:hypothetical protein|nr:hypothetical protein [Chitinophagaceae bacterium]
MMPEINRRVFWDVNAEKIDFFAKSKFVVERVFERGDVSDIRAIRAFYGDKKIKGILQNAKWLDEATVYLAAAIFNCSLNSFKCYKSAQSNPEHWIY